LSYLLRALFFGVPALIVLFGGYYMAPKTSTSDDALQPGSSFMAAIEWPSEDDADLVRRVAIKQETTLDLLDGRLTLEDAIDRFRLISPASSNESEKENVSRYAQQVVSFTRAHAVRDPERYQAAYTKLEARIRSRESSSAVTDGRTTEDARLHDSGSPFGF